jgi:DNA-directed RNA polymerase specialized sigma24 family protein
MTQAAELSTPALTSQPAWDHTLTAMAADPAAPITDPVTTSTPPVDPPAIPPVDPTADPMDDPRRHAILWDREIHKAIQVVARLRGVPRFEVDEVLGEVILQAMDDPNLPLDRDEAKKYLCGSARFKSIDKARERTRSGKREKELDEELAAPGPARAFDAVLASRVLREGQKRFPKTFQWFLRTTFGRATAVQIAVELRVDPGHVRKELSVIRRTLTTIVVLVGLALGVRHLYMPGHHVDRDRDLADTAKSAPLPPPPPPPLPSSAPSASNDQTPQDVAKTLRDRAKARSTVGDWQGCVDGLNGANTVLGTGEPEPDDVAKLRKVCEGKLLDNVKQRGFPQQP